MKLCIPSSHHNWSAAKIIIKAVDIVGCVSEKLMLFQLTKEMPAAAHFGHRL